MQSELSVGEIMEADHVELDELLAELIDAIYRDQPDGVSTYRKLDLFWARLAVHIRAEHLVVFPAVLDIGKGPGKEHDDIENILQELRDDHDFFIKELARAVKAMRLVPDFGNESETFEVVRDLVSQVKRRLERHNQIEEEMIYPLAAETDAEHAQLMIRDNALKELENLPRRFQTT
jgi:iron-sulfur cluster repair protein YtfE (RIC family)